MPCFICAGSDLPRVLWEKGGITVMKVKAIIGISELKDHLEARRAAREELSYAMDLLQERKEEWRKYIGKGGIK